MARESTPARAVWTAGFQPAPAPAQRARLDVRAGWKPAFHRVPALAAPIRRRRRRHAEEGEPAGGLFAAPRFAFGAVKIIFAAPKMTFAAAQIVFAAVKTVFAAAQIIFAAPKVIFAAPKVIFTAPKVIFTAVKIARGECYLTCTRPHAA